MPLYSMDKRASFLHKHLLGISFGEWGQGIRKKEEEKATSGIPFPSKPEAVDCCHWSRGQKWSKTFQARGVLGFGGRMFGQGGRSRSSPLSHPVFGWEGSPAKIDCPYSNLATGGPSHRAFVEQQGPRAEKWLDTWKFCLLVFVSPRRREDVMNLGASENVTASEQGLISPSCVDLQKSPSTYSLKD